MAALDWSQCPPVESFYVPTPRTTKTGPFGAGPCTLAGTFGGLIV
jgi:hypothetical protein